MLIAFLTTLKSTYYLTTLKSSCVEKPAKIQDFNWVWNRDLAMPVVTPKGVKSEEIN